MNVAETVDATKTRFAAAEALKLLDGIDTLIAQAGESLKRPAQ